MTNDHLGGHQERTPVVGFRDHVPERSTARRLQACFDCHEHAAAMLAQLDGAGLVDQCRE